MSPQGNHLHRANVGGAEDRSELLRRGWSGRDGGAEEAEKGQRDVVVPVTW